jgi:hypothetical protein
MSAWRFLLLVVATAGMSITGTAAHGDGQCVGAATAGQDWYNASAVCAEPATPAEESVAQVSSAAAETTYSYDPVCIRGEGIQGESFYGCGGQMKCGSKDKGRLFSVYAHYSDGTTAAIGEQCFEPDEAPVAPTPQVTQALVLRAFERIPVPASRVSIQPPGGKTLVNLETIFSTEAQEFTRTIGLLGHRVDLEIWPSRFEWVTGDGADFATDWAGRPWEKGVPLGEFITHIYDDAQGVTTRVDTTWSARYRVDGGSWNDVGGTVTIEGEPFDLAVLSAEPHLVG